LWKGRDIVFNGAIVEWFKRFCVEIEVNAGDYATNTQNIHIFGVNKRRYYGKIAFIEKSAIEKVPFDSI